MLQSAGRSLSNAWDRALFFVRTYWLPSLLAFVLLSGGLVYWASTGFSLQLGRSSASSTEKAAPWYYCDYATKACAQAPAGGIGGVTTDFDATDCSSAGGSCALGKCRRREGSGRLLTDWAPLETPDKTPACEPLTKITAATFPGFGTRFFREGPGITPGFITPADMDPAPVNFPDCLYLENGYGTAEPNFGQMTVTTVPQVGATRPLEYKAFIVNNCPWEVHLVFLVDGGRKAEFNPGVIGAGSSRGGLPESEASQLITEDTAPSRDFKSCWNSGALQRPETCGKMISIKINMNTYTCGSVGLQMAWWHRTNNNAAGGQNALADNYCDDGGKWQERGCSAQTGRGTGFISVLNYGKDCTGAPGERAPGGLGGATPSAGACPAAPAPPAVKTANPKVVCGTTQNVITWENPKSLNAAVNSVLRTEKRADGTTEAKFVFGEGGCWNTFGISTYTDKDIKAGSTYSYAIKTHPNVRSADVACKDGLPVTPPPSPSASAAPISPSPTTTTTFPSPTFTPAPTFFSPTPTPDDSDNDGVPDEVECPGLVNCPDTDGDGAPDYLDSDSDNDGIPDGTDCNRLVAGTCTGSAGQVQTGPGEATLLALIISALVSLLYVTYTHSPLGLRREAEDISKDQGPMDFRS